MYISAAVIGSFNTPPNSSAGGRSVLVFYERHGAAIHAKNILVTFAFLFLLFFVGVLRAHLRRVPAVEGLIALMPAVAAVLLAGTTTVEGIEFVLAGAPDQLSPAAAQTLNILHTDLLLTKAAALFALGILSGLAILVSRLLPRWLGWLAIAFGVAAFTPLQFEAFLALVVWSLGGSALIWTARGDSPRPSVAAELSVPVA
jgi:hypothetical protein